MEASRARANEAPPQKSPGVTTNDGGAAGAPSATRMSLRQDCQHAPGAREPHWPAARTPVAGWRRARAAARPRGPAADAAAARAGRTRPDDYVRARSRRAVHDAVCARARTLFAARHVTVITAGEDGRRLLEPDCQSGAHARPCQSAHKVHVPGARSCRFRAATMRPAAELSVTPLLPPPWRGECVLGPPGNPVVG
jgi:hypothetical protein